MKGDLMRPNTIIEKILNPKSNTLLGLIRDMYRSLSTAKIEMHQCAPVKMCLPIFQVRRLLMTA